MSPQYHESAVTLISAALVWRSKMSSVEHQLIRERSVTDARFPALHGLSPAHQTLWDACVEYAAGISHPSPTERERITVMFAPSERAVIQTTVDWWTSACRYSTTWKLIVAIDGHNALHDRPAAARETEQPISPTIQTSFQECRTTFGFPPESTDHEVLIGLRDMCQQARKIVGLVQAIKRELPMPEVSAEQAIESALSVVQQAKLAGLDLIAGTLRVPKFAMGNWSAFVPLPENSGLTQRGVMVEWDEHGGVTAGMDGGPFIDLHPIPQSADATLSNTLRYTEWYSDDPREFYSKVTDQRIIVVVDGHALVGIVDTKHDNRVFHTENGQKAASCFVTDRDKHWPTGWQWCRAPAG